MWFGLLEFLPLLNADGADAVNSVVRDQRKCSEKGAAQQILESGGKMRKCSNDLG